MKKIAVLLLMSVICVGTYAQPPRPRPQGPQSAQMQNLQEAKVNAMVRILELSGDKEAKFREIYISYDDATREAAATHLQNSSNIHRLDSKDVTHEQMQQSVLSQIALSQELLEIKKVYFEYLDAILTPSQMLEFYKNENTIRTQIQREYSGRQERR